MNSIELFAGAGGLALGVSMAGFRSQAIIELNKWACDTIKENQIRGFSLVQQWPLWIGDVHNFNFSEISNIIDLLAGGPPCQPFSVGGKHRAFYDRRDMFPSTIDIIRKLRPKTFIIENVKGLMRSSFLNYYQYILLQLEYLDIPRKDGETWMEHMKRLQEEKTSGIFRTTDISYNVIPTLVNAADYGVPQKRERVFIVGIRADLNIKWSFPQPTHSLDALLYSQWKSGEYWDRHKISQIKSVDISYSIAKINKNMDFYAGPPTKQPWVTIRDAFIDLPDPRHNDKQLINNHIFQNGARIYKGHVGSVLDFPAKTLKAGDHGVPGGENMMVLDSGEVRYFTVREAARLQTFPDDYIFHGSWTETMRQLGNAVPVNLSYIVAKSIADKLIHEQY